MNLAMPLLLNIHIAPEQTNTNINGWAVDQFLIFFSFAVSPNGSIEVDPDIEIVDAGGNVTFTCSANGGPNNTFLWLRSDSFSISSTWYTNFSTLVNNVPVAVDEVLRELENVTLTTGAQLNIMSVNASEDGGSYTCIVINQAGADTAEASLYVRLVVLEQPTDELSSVSDMAYFTFRAESFPPPSYQWQKFSGAGFSDVENETEEILFFSSVSYDNFGTYRCVANASLANDTITSDDVTLTGMLLIGLRT